MADSNLLSYDHDHMVAGAGEAVILTGGASSRMGRDKATLEVDGISVIERLISEFKVLAWQVTVLGREPVSGAKFQGDATEFAGPVASLRDFSATTPFVFVLSCDVVLFRSKIPVAFADLIDGFDAVIPNVADFDQPLCGLYRREAFDQLKLHPDVTRVKDWAKLLHVRRVASEELNHMGVAPEWVSSANTPDEFHRLVRTATEQI